MCATCGCGETGEKHVADHEHGHEHEHVMADGSVVKHSHGTHDHDSDHGHDGHPREERCARSREPEPAGATRDLRAEPHVESGQREDDPVGADLERAQGTADRGHRGRSADRPNDASASRHRRKAIQINTGKGCHLDAHMVGHAHRPAAAARTKRPAVSSRMSAISSVRPRSISARRTRSSCLGDRGRGQAAQVPGHVRAARSAAAEQIDLLPHLDFDLRQLEDRT
jgi:hydrogenase nickel incorporation protein HypB